MWGDTALVLNRADPSKSYFRIRVSHRIDSQPALGYVLLHEIAHVEAWDLGRVSGGPDHGEAWGRAYARTYRRLYAELIRRDAQSSGAKVPRPTQRAGPKTLHLGQPLLDIAKEWRRARARARGERKGPDRRRLPVKPTRRPAR